MCILSCRTEAACANIAVWETERPSVTYKLQAALRRSMADLDLRFYSRRFTERRRVLGQTPTL